jgi:hypothetical protein
MAEVTGQKESRPVRDRAAHWKENEVNTGILSTALSAVCFLLAFTYLRGIEQLLVISLGGLLAGGGK